MYRAISGQIHTFIPITLKTFGVRLKGESLVSIIMFHQSICIGTQVNLDTGIIR